MLDRRNTARTLHEHCKRARTNHDPFLLMHAPSVDKADLLDDLTQTELKVYNTIVEGRVITRVEIAEATGLSETAVKRTIAKLTDKALIKRIGGDKVGRWVKVT